MTERELKQFLKAEGWTRKRVKWEAHHPAGLHWFGPKGEAEWDTWTAYRIAKRRKDARDRARLKKAGWVHRTRPYECWSRHVSDGHWETSTKAGALATLEIL